VNIVGLGLKAAVTTSACGNRSAAFVNQAALGNAQQKCCGLGCWSWQVPQPLVSLLLLLLLRMWSTLSAEA
jgi:hypothetical protein